MNELHTVYFSLGSNLGDREENIFLALERIGELIGEVERQSSLYTYEPWGFESENEIVNAAACCSTKLTPQQVLRKIQQIERELGKRPEHATLRDEAFGQRHFIAADPNSVMIDVIKPIPPSAEHAAQYAPEALPT